MKKISIFLLVLISSACYSQSVKLEDLITHFLQKDDSLQVIKSIIVDKDSIIGSQKQQLITSDKIVETYQKDSIQYNLIISEKDSIINNQNKEIKIVKKQNRKARNKLILSVFGLSALEAGTLILLIMSLK